jgi:uncharacterized protein (TIGR02099 family)
MSDKVVEWLGQGVVDGRVSKGRVLYHGFSRDFPFNHGEGKFEVAFHVEDAVISPGEGWPKIEDINADVTFAGSTMEVLTSKGRLYDSQLSTTRVAIAEMRGKPARLTIDGQIEGPTINALRYLLESPLHDRFSYLDIFVIEGHSKLDLAMDIPLASGYEVAVNGQVDVRDNSLLITPAKLPLTGVQGSLSFSSDHGVEAESISGQLYGHPLSAKVSGHTNGQGSATLIEGVGQFDGVALAKYFELPLLEKLVVGEAPIAVQVYVPSRGDGEKLPTTVQIGSPLTGMAIDLIPPLSKDAERERKLVVNISLPEDKAPVINIDYGEQLSGILSIDKVLRGEVVFGEGTPQLSELPGVSVIGEIPALSVTALMDRFAHLSDNTGPPRQDTSALDMLSNLDLTIGQFEILGQPFTPLRVVATRMADQWVLDVESQQIAGKLYLAKHYLRDPLIMELDRLKLAKLPDDENKTEKGTLVLDSLPPLQITSKQLFYDEMSLGNLKLASRKDAAGYYIDHLSIAPEAATITLQGAWLVRDESQHSSINVKVDSRDVGKTLDALKYGGVINKGEGTLEVKLTWPDAPTAFAGNILNGDLTIKLEDGRLLDVEPGAGGRMLGLLAWQGIGRRLTLDFSDIFSKGFSFNHIKGGYALSKGVATTRDLTIEGPSARVDITGTVDLGEQHYDMHALVTPHVTDNLPIIGALAATPQVGAVIWLTQKLFKKELDKIAQFEYTIVGPWDNPVTKKVGDDR